MIGSLPQIQGAQCYGGPVPASGGYTALSGLSGSLLGSYAQGAGPAAGYCAIPQSAAALGCYVGTPPSAAAAAAYSYGSQGAAYAQSSAPAYGYSDARNFVCAPPVPPPTASGYGAYHNGYSFSTGPVLGPGTPGLSFGPAPTGYGFSSSSSLLGYQNGYGGGFQSQVAQFGGYSFGGYAPSPAWGQAHCQHPHWCPPNGSDGAVPVSAGPSPGPASPATGNQCISVGNIATANTPIDMTQPPAPPSPPVFSGNPNPPAPPPPPPPPPSNPWASATPPIVGDPNGQPLQPPPSAAMQAAQAQFGAVDLNNVGDFLTGVGAVNQALGPRPGHQVTQVNGPGAKGPFTVDAYQYWNTDTQSYVPVDNVLIAQKGNYNDNVRDYNVSGVTDFQAVKPDAVVGQNYQVTVTWQDGKQKVWDYTMSAANGTNISIDSPYT